MAVVRNTGLDALKKLNTVHGFWHTWIVCGYGVFRLASTSTKYQQTNDQDCCVSHNLNVAEKCEGIVKR